MQKDLERKQRAWREEEQRLQIKLIKIEDDDVEKEFASMRRQALQEEPRWLKKPAPKKKQRRQQKR